MKRKSPIKKTVSYLRENGLSIIEADEERSFVVMPQKRPQKRPFAEKATEAVQKNFKPTDFRSKIQRKQAVRLLKKMNLEGIVLFVSKALEMISKDEIYL